jgi:TolA-binding protein
MQSDGQATSFTKQMQLLVATREEDFQELSKKIADVQRQHNAKVESMTERIVQLERRVAGL